MDKARLGDGNLLVSIWGAAGVFMVGFFGAEALFGPAAEGIGVGATLLPSILAAVGAFLYLLIHGVPEPESAPLPVESPLSVESSERADTTPQQAPSPPRLIGGGAGS